MKRKELCMSWTGALHGLMQRVAYKRFKEESREHKE